jgi:hypothetical protein
MAWEWSHTPEAYENVRNNIRTLDHEDLAVVYSEIIGKEHDDSLEEDDSRCCFKASMYEAEAEKARSMEKDFLVGYIIAFAEKHRTCDNGGFNAHICPYGCHTVSFDHED